MKFQELPNTTVTFSAKVLKTLPPWIRVSQVATNACTKKDALSAVILLYL